MIDDLASSLDITITEEDVNNKFTDKWEENVADAAFIAALYSSNLNKSPEEIIREVVNYNVTKNLRELFVSKSKPLPKNITWKKGYSVTNANYLFENYMSQIFLFKETDNLKEKVTLNLTIEDDRLQNAFSVWLEIAMDTYKNIKIKSKQDKKDPSKFKVTFE